MAPKQLLLIGAGTAVAGGGATGAYFLISEKKETTVSTKDTSKVVKKKSLQEELIGVNFLSMDDDTNKSQWGELVDKFLSDEVLNVEKIATSEIKRTEPATNKDENIEALKKACTGLLAKTDFKEGDKNIAKNWCSSASTLLTKTRPDSSTRSTVGS